jgi:hypothetical protein
MFRSPGRRGTFPASYGPSYANQRSTSHGTTTASTYRCSSHFGCVFLQLCQIVKRVGTAQLALSKAYAGAFAVRITTQKPRASNPFTHFSIRRRIVSGES